MKPVLQALVLAEKIWKTDTGQKIIAGTFNAITLQERPAQPQEGQPAVLRGGVPGSPYAYISLTDVCDSTTIELQFVSLSRNRVLFEKKILIERGTRLGTIEIVAPLPPLKVPEPGTYALEIVCEGEIIGSSKIIAELDDNA